MGHPCDATKTTTSGVAWRQCCRLMKDQRREEKGEKIITYLLKKDGE